MGKKIICIVEDKEDLREGMGLMIDTSNNYSLAGSFANAEEALQKFRL